MVTTEIFESLKELQTILVQKYELEKKVADAPKQLRNQEELLAKTQKEFIELKSQYDVLAEKINKIKSDLNDAISEREEGEKGVANSTTHREYETLEKQIAEAKLKEDNLRHELQHEDKKLADVDEKMKNTEELIHFQESELNSSKDSLNSELSGYNSELSELKSKEDKIVPNLDQEILFKFQRIIQRNSEGIVAVRNGVCTGCHMILPANFANEVREGENINFCPYCSRILFYEEVSEEQSEDYFNMGLAGSLAGLDDDDFDEESEDKDEYEENEELDDSFDDEDSSDLEESVDDDIDDSSEED